MDCQTIRELLALHIGGNLSPDQAIHVERHLEQCADCRVEFEQYGRAQSTIRNIAEADTPTLPGNFTAAVMSSLSQSPMKRRSIWSFWPRGAAAACLFGLIAILWFQISRDFSQFKHDRLAVQLEQVRLLVSRDPSLIDTDRLAGYNVRGPVALNEWEPSGDAGIFAILHKPDPENQPDLYSVDYLGEASRIEYRGDTWRRQRINRLTERTGSPDNIYIAEYPMPNRSVDARRAALNVLKDSLQPYYN